MEVVDLTAESPPPRRRRARPSVDVVDLTSSPAGASQHRGSKRRRDEARAAASAAPAARRQRLLAACGPCECCGATVPLSELLAHEAECATARARAAAARGGAPDSACPWCGALFTAAALALHGGACKALPARFASGALPLSLAAAYANDGVRLTAAQTAAMAHVNARAAPAAAAALPKLRERAAALGFSNADLERCLAHIRDRAPLVIHLDAGRMLPLLLKDTHYRNLHEVGTSGGLPSTVARDVWEADMFANAYRGAAAAEKVKYGALNVTCDARGVRAAHGYGDSYLQLAAGVRLRASFAFYDTGDPDARACLATCEHYAHVLAAYPQADLQLALEVGAGRRSSGASSQVITTYKEVQLHGPVELARHVEALVVNPRHVADAAVRANATQFGQKFGCLVVQEDADAAQHATTPWTHAAI